MWNWVKRVFGGTSSVLMTAAVAVAKARLDESINKTDKLDETEKLVVKELIDQFINDLRAELNK